MWYRRVEPAALLSRYISHPTTHILPTAYMLLEDVRSETSQTLSCTWEKQRHDPEKRKTLFRGLSRVMVSLARTPQPRIGSFRFHNGTVALTNRPLHSAIAILENEGTPRTVQSDTTYSCTEPFVTDVFNFYDRHFLAQPNAACDDYECYGIMSARVMLRSLTHHYILPDRRYGPFFLQLTDVRPSNIFVDHDWNVTCLVGLEWVCAFPLESLTVPYWLTGRKIDEFSVGQHEDEFARIQAEFLDILEEEEGQVQEHGLSLAQTMRETWASGGFWFWHCVKSANALVPLFKNNIWRRFTHYFEPDDQGMIGGFWSTEDATVLSRARWRLSGSTKRSSSNCSTGRHMNSGHHLAGDDRKS